MGELFKPMGRLFIMFKTKICTKCGEELPATTEYFAKSKDGKFGLKASCKKCNSVYRKIHYEENKDDIREKQNEYLKLYYSNNKDKILEYKHKHYEDNKDKILIHHKQYQAKNKIKISIYKRTYKKENREYFRMHNNKRKALKKKLPNTLSAEQWEMIKNDFNNKCAYCGQALPLAQEHFIPLSKGGEFTINNIIPACVSCNSSKWNNDFFEWYPKYKYYSKKREKFILEYLGYNQNKQQLSIL